MLERLTAVLFNFFTSVVSLYTIPQVLGYSATFVAVVIVSTRQGRKERFFRRDFRTDIAHSIWFPVYTILIGAPILMRIATVVSEHAPFLRVGILNGMPTWISLPILIVDLDFVRYWLHRSMHRWRWLWALHKVHHSSRDINPLTTWRVHWLEFIYLNSVAFCAVLLLGEFRALHPIVVGLLAASQFAQHSDIDWTYGPVGKLIVSPRFHARHHSVSSEDVNVNFGSLLIVWDHLFGTARKVASRPPAYGLAPPEDSVPPSFLGQQLYPLSILWRATRLRRTA